MEEKKPHVVCVPFPAQGHINPMLQLAKLLHSRGFFITFVHTDYTHKRLSTLDSFDGFRFEVISDGFSPSTVGEVQEYRNAEHLCQSLKENCVASFRDLLMKLHHPSDGHRVTCVVSDPIMTFILKVSEEMGIPEVIFCPTAACGFMAFTQYHELMRRGLVPLKDESCISNGYLDTIIDWIPGMRDIRLRDLGSYLQTTDPKDFMFNFIADSCPEATAAPEAPQEAPAASADPEDCQVAAVVEVPPEAAVVVPEAAPAAPEASAVEAEVPPEIDCNVEAAAL
ncbi:hypothetical protein MRB53_026126 [Persea americana]|uniref:Uncharacterized protein n=1 Tax=Persea americana TaxID=3435 RepID=A0ACC2LH43_PERAE|nr:hypothetical protein MRB53_026126 [Persea americana]